MMNMDGTKSFPEFKCKIVLSLVPTKNYIYSMTCNFYRL